MGYFSINNLYLSKKDLHLSQQGCAESGEIAV